MVYLPGHLKPEKHPELEVVTRDRARAYAEAARERAKKLYQEIHARFHLWRARPLVSLSLRSLCLLFE
jgi:hypothetical protein